jgi:hypothetical protein
MVGIGGRTMSECKGFTWLGQSFACCDNCGKPYWEHTHDARIIRSRPINARDAKSCYEYVPITDEQKRRVRAYHYEKPRAP